MTDAQLLSDERIIHLRDGDLRAGLAPDCGGSIAYLTEDLPGGAIDWFRPATIAALDERNGELMACFPLVPVSGRVADAMLMWDGARVPLPRNVASEGNHLHGEGWQLPWRLLSADNRTASLSLDSGTSDWPFRYSARLDYSLDSNGLDISIGVRNDGPTAMPAAIGLHPWFPAPAAMLTANAKTLWAIDDDRLFAGKSSPEPHRDFRTERSLAAADLEHGFSDWDGRARLRWPGRDRLLEITASPELAHLVVYTRHPSGAFCLEPVSCSVDAFNLHAAGVQGTGTMCLGSGCSLTGKVRFAIH